MFSVDVSKAIAHAQRAAKLHREFPKLLVTRIRRARDEERRTHIYRNRTGNLQRHTQVIPSGGTGPDRAYWLVMGEDYASHVERRGFSDFKRIVKDAADDIEDEQIKIARAVTGT